VRRPIGFRRFPTSSRPWIGTASPGVLPPYGACAPGAPFRRGQHDPTTVTRGATPSPVPPSGFFQPLGGFSRDVRKQARVAPDLQRPPLRPGAPRPYSMPQTPLGFPLQSFLLSKSRAASRRPSAPLRVRRRPDLRRGRPGVSRKVSRRAPAPSCEPASPEGREDATEGSGPRFPRPLSRLSFMRVAPHADLDGRPDLPGSPAPAGSPASKPCSLREYVRAGTEHSFELAPDLASEPPGRCSPGVQPLWSLLHHDLGSGRPRGSQASRSLLDTPGRPRPLRTTKRGASILSPRPSRSGGRVRVATQAHHRQTLRASAPPLGGAPSSHALHRPQQREPPDDRLSFRGF